MTDFTTHTIGICDTQPIAAEGLRSLLSPCSELEFKCAVQSLDRAFVLARGIVDVLIVDKAFGMNAVLDLLAELRNEPDTAAVVVWGISITEPEALRLLQSGARAIIRKSSETENLIACLRAVAAGRTWMENRVFRDGGRTAGYPRSALTAREQQVMKLVELGFKNREIAAELGIKAGTVKIHLKHIFEKTGVHGRYGLALNGLRDKGLVSLAS
ncbi:MAG TPA: response regulator transcription factor [Bryobacteraceae bacterium]|nr:response regulator transcription factor [Bryobacteraceae bacterium]